MPASRQTLMGRNPPRSAVKKKGICGVCGEDVIAATLVWQRNTLVSRLHHGCLDNPRVYCGPRVRGPYYGGMMNSAENSGEEVVLPVLGDIINSAENASNEVVLLSPPMTNTAENASNEVVD